MSNQPLTAEKNTLSTGIKIPAHIISFIFHPLFIATYVMAFMAYVHPYAFIGVPENMKLFKVVLFVFFNTAFLPLFAVFLMRQLKLIDSMFLTTQKERIIPYTAKMYRTKTEEGATWKDALGSLPIRQLNSILLCELTLSKD